MRASASEKALSLIAQKNPPRNRSSKVCIRSARDHYPSTRPKTRSRPRDGLSRDLNPEKVTLAHGLGRVDGYHRGYHCRRRGKRIERRRPFFLLCVVLLRKVSFVRCRGITTPRPDPRLALDRDRKVCIRSARDHYPSTRPKTRSRPREYRKTKPREGDSGTDLVDDGYPGYHCRRSKRIERPRPFFCERCILREKCFSHAHARLIRL